MCVSMPCSKPGGVELEITTFCRVAIFCPFPLVLMVIWCGRLYRSAEEEYARNGYSWRFISRVRCWSRWCIVGNGGGISDDPFLKFLSWGRFLFTGGFIEVNRICAAM